MPYAKVGASEYLTLVTNPYFGSELANRYVAMGYWQRNLLFTGSQRTLFSTFTYGFDTPASSVPRTGAAHWLTDVFGIYSVPGHEPRTVQGYGDFEVDFPSNAFQFHAFLSEYQVITDGGTSGSLGLLAGGQLTGDGRFSGIATYNGSVGGEALLGTLTGSFYGPAAEEMGAVFNASKNGITVTGAMTGQRFPVGGTSDGMRNISLTNVLVERLLQGGLGAGVFATAPQVGETGFRQVTPRYTDLQATLKPSGLPSIGFTYAYTPNPAEIVADGRQNFVTYQATIAGRPTKISYYKVGSENQELALTYASFASMNWSSGAPSLGDGFQADYGIYGIRTQLNLLQARTGTATYLGLVYGAGAALSGTTYDVTGNSRFDVDFSGSTYSGWLDLRGTTLAGTLTDFGRVTFQSTLGAGEPLQATLVGSGISASGSIQPRFYGPTGQEIGAAFNAGIGTAGSPQHTVIGGIALAKSQ